MLQSFWCLKPYCVSEATSKGGIIVHTYIHMSLSPGFSCIMCSAFCTLFPRDWDIPVLQRIVFVFLLQKVSESQHSAALSLLTKCELAWHILVLCNWPELCCLELHIWLWISLNMEARGLYETIYLTFIDPCIAIYSYSTTNKMRLKQMYLVGCTIRSHLYCCIGRILPSTYSGLSEDGSSKLFQYADYYLPMYTASYRKTIALTSIAVITFSLAKNSPILQISCSPVSCDRSVPSHPETPKCFLLLSFCLCLRLQRRFKRLLFLPLALKSHPFTFLDTFTLIF